MFKGSASVSFTTTKPQKEVYELIEEELNSVGKTEVSDRGTIKINSSKMEGALNEAIIDGTLRNKDGKFTIEVNFESKPKIFVWLLFCLGIFPGLIALFLVSNTKGEMQNKIDRALDNVNNEFK